MGWGRLLAALVAGLGLVSPAAAALHGRGFRTQDGIVCEWRQAETAIACGRLSDGATIVLPLIGKPYDAPGAVYYFDPDPVMLSYGHRWSSLGLVCMSRVRGVRCENRHTRHVFVIGRQVALYTTDGIRRGG